MGHRQRLIRLLYYLPLERMTEEELEKELEKLKDFKLYVFEGEVYVKAEDYKEKAIENKKLKEEREFFYKSAKQFREENEKLNKEIENHKQNIMQDELEIIPKLEEENEKLKETIKDHQLYEEKLEHRIIEFEELLHGE